MANILIAGCGNIGRELGNRLTDTGHQVTGLKRRPPFVNPDKFQYLQADIALSLQMDKVGGDYDYVFFILSPDTRNLESYRKIYTHGLMNLASRLSHARWFFVSSTSVYGQHQGEWVNEDSPATGNSDTSRLILEAEQHVKEMNAENIIVRFSGIYGPGREHLLNQARQNPVIQQHPPYYTNRIHHQDCVSVLAFLFEQRVKGISLDSCYVASDDDPAPLWEVMTWLCEQLNQPHPTAKMVDSTTDMNKRCRNDKLNRLGYQFRYPSFRQGYDKLIHTKNAGHH